MNLQNSINTNRPPERSVVRQHDPCPVSAGAFEERLARQGLLSIQTSPLVLY